MVPPPTYALTSAATVFGVVTRGGAMGLCELPPWLQDTESWEVIYGGFWKIWWPWPVVIPSRFERWM